jgi:alkylated DNA nucleotide flippase Atl1
VVSDGLPTPYDERVLDLVAALPAGRAVSYGDVAETLAEGGPRQVGRTLGRFGSGVPWWRVVRADGSAAPGLEVEARRRWAAEAMPRTRDGRRIDLAVARPDLAALAAGARRPGGPP